MRSLIRQIRSTMPFAAAEAQLCSGECNGCSKKLLDYLESELDAWELRLDQGERPGLGDLSQLIRTTKKIHRVLERNGLVEARSAGERVG
ncbi:hypothetical protein [Thiorhodococcus mannitoliphagus]|nr:hypothetical protein [Thiorhodococcus mannitoliphagus]